MKNKLGFTLLELLVVVLIIGILTSIALPQYNKAVEKSKATQGITLLKTLGQAADLYYLQKGEFPSSLEDFDVQFPSDWTGTEKFWNEQVIDVRSNGEWSLLLQVQKPSNTYIIWLGRLKGKYRGTGFGYYPVKQSINLPTNIPTNILLCAEVKNGTIPFQGKEDSYCTKIWNGTRVHNGTMRIYTFKP